MRIAAVIAAVLSLGIVGTSVAAETRSPAAPSKAAPKRPKPVPSPQAQQESKAHALVQAASRGEEDAQYLLAVALREGRGMKVDWQAALDWFMLAGSNGVVEAAVEAAKAFEEGIGTRRDVASAARWRYRAGELGHEPSRRMFVDLFISGQVDELAGPAAIGWVTELAAQGHVDAQIRLGEAYELGLGIVPDPAKARQWYRTAATLGAAAEARFRLGRLLLSEKGVIERDGSGVTTEISRPGMVEGERWLLAAADQNHDGAQALLGTLYAEGLELPMNLTTAIGYLEAAASQLNPDALIALAGMAEKGYGFTVKDPYRAFVWYDLAAQLGRRPAEESRDRIAKALNQKQLARARQLAQECRELRGL